MLTALLWFESENLITAILIYLIKINNIKIVFFKMIYDGWIIKTIKKVSVYNISKSELILNVLDFFIDRM